MRLRILHAVHSVDPASGGTFEWIKQIALLHQQQGHKVEIICLLAPDSPAVLACPVTCYGLGSDRGGYGYSAAWVPWIQAHAADYDVIIVNALWQYTTWGVWRATRDRKIPYVVFPHGMLDPWFKRTYPLKHAKKWFYWNLIEHRVLRDAAAVVFTGEEERRLARQSFRRYACQEEVIPLGIAGPPQLRPPVQPHPNAFVAERSKRFVPCPAFLQEFPHLANQRLLLFLGRLHPKKGPDLTIQAFAALLRRHPAAAQSAHLVIAGSAADPAYQTELTQLAQSNGVANSVTWTGLITGDRKWAALRAADAFILPSHQENFGVAPAEALACGVPVILSDQVGLWPPVKAANAGWVGPDTAAATAELVEQWWQTPPAEMTQLRENARKCFEANFTIEQAAGRLTDLLQRIIRTKS